MYELLDIEALIEEMTLEEKATLVNGGTFFGTVAIERVGIPRIQLLDGGTGINFEQLFGDITQLYHWSEDNLIGSTILVRVIDNYYTPDNLDEKETELYNWIKKYIQDRVILRCNNKNYAPACFPPGILLGATWNKEICNKVGQALGMEANIFGVNMLLGTPNVNIHRDPLNGRLFEGYSEDPHLVSVLAPELVKGVQEYGVIANVKHFAANNQETNRVGINEIIPARALEEIYLRGFKACVTEGKVETVMSAYNKINGIPCTESSYLLTNKLRGEWGFEGFVVSDWGAVFNPDKAIAAGNDLIMPGPIPCDKVVEAVNNGNISMEDLNASVRSILGSINWLMEHDNHNVYDGDEVKEFTDEVAYEAAAEGIIMLKNDGTFPLSYGKKIILAGSGANKLLECGAGSAGIRTNRIGDFLGELENNFGIGNVFVANSYNDICALKMREDLMDNKSIVLVVCSQGGMEGNDRRDLMLASDDLDIVNNLQESYGLILNTCGPVDMSFDSPYLKGVWCMFLPGMMGAKAMADILVGKVNPSGKLPLTFPKRYEDTPTSINFPGDGFEVNYGEGIYVGYRYYDKKKIESKYSFGYGLSYTDFNIETKEFNCDGGKVAGVNAFTDKVSIRVKISNVGEMAGSQVLQIYVADPVSTLSKPIKELKAFEKIYLDVKEEKEIEITLSIEDFESYDNNLKGWFAEEGFYDIIVATSANEIDEADRIRVYLKNKSPYVYGANSPIKVIYEKEELNSLLFKMWDRYGIDRGYIENNYMYTPHRTLKQIVMDISETRINEDIKETIIKDFSSLAEGVIKE